MRWFVDLIEPYLPGMWCYGFGLVFASMVVGLTTAPWWGGVMVGVFFVVASVVLKIIKLRSYDDKNIDLKRSKIKI